LGSSKPPVQRAPRIRQPAREAEEIAIRFVNTVAWRLRQPVEERLGSPEAMLEWLTTNGFGGPGDRTEMPDAWKAQLSDGGGFYETAIRLREVIYDLLVARMAGTEPPAAALDFFNDFACRGLSGLALRWQGGELLWGLDLARAELPDLLGPILLSGAQLLTGPRAGAVRQCQDDRGCGWLFVDESRRQNRRWCSMGDCGNRAKARRHHERTRRRAAKD
jgi:predicted RNA-binding Zn ribbon-like protein